MEYVFYAFAHNGDVQKFLILLMSLPGILDHDELTFINEGFKTSEMQRATCKDVHPHIFEPGYSTKDDAVSSGSTKFNPSFYEEQVSSYAPNIMLNIVI